MPFQSDFIQNDFVQQEAPTVTLPTLPYGLGGPQDLPIPLPIPPLGDPAPLQVEALALPEGVELKWRAPLENSRFALRVDAGGGTFTLTFTTPAGTREDGATAFTTAGGTVQTTDPIPYNASTADVRAELLTLSNLDEGDVFTSGGLLSDPTTLVDLVGIELSGQYQGLRIDTFTMDDTNLTDVVEALLQTPPEHLVPRRNIERFHVQVWTGEFDGAGVLVRNDEWVLTESLVHPTQTQEEHFLRVRSISTDGLPSVWVEESVTPTPLPEMSDGIPPDDPDAPVVRGGPGFLAVEWARGPDDDLLTLYDVHVSTVNDFTPDATTFHGTIAGTLYFIKAMPDGSALAYGTTYRVKIVAYDPDGTSLVSPQGSASMVQVTQADLVANNIITNAMLAGSITADKITAGDLTGVTITGVTITGGIVRTSNGTTRVEMTSADANAIRFFVSNTVVGSLVGGSGKLTIFGFNDLVLNSVKLGFFGAAGITKWNVTGARNNPEAALLSLLNAMDNYGLIDNNSTAS